MKKFIKYWLPPLIWMAIIFPVGNQFLSSPFLYGLNLSFWRWLFPDTGYAISGVSYIIIRKSLHFIEYAILAFLLYRGFRAGSPAKWKFNWAVYAGLIAIGYGFLDEFLQSFIPSRKGSLIDGLINSAGAVFTLGIVALKSKKRLIHHE